jgi:hypothetical protein
MKGYLDSAYNTKMAEVPKAEEVAPAELLAE